MRQKNNENGRDGFNEFLIRGKLLIEQGRRGGGELGKKNQIQITVTDFYNAFADFRVPVEYEFLSREFILSDCCEVWLKIKTLVIFVKYQIS